MIQRVQSIYLLLITILMSFLLVWPYAALELPDNHSLLFRAQNISNTSPPDIVSVYKITVPVILLVLFIGMAGFVIIFLYNNRILQIRLTMLNLLLIVILIAVMLYYAFDVRSEFDLGKFQFRFAMIFPVLSLIFSILAIRAIRHDEMIVSSYNRIR